MARLHAEFIVDRALKQVDATDEQRQAIQASVERLLAQHESLRGQHAQLHQDLVAALTADRVDRERLEALRAQQITKIEQMSRELAQTAGDVANVLTPNQRKKLIDWAEELDR